MLYLLAWQFLPSDPRYSLWRAGSSIYGAIALAISMLGIAGFFLLLDSPFVAMFQITVYVGAVAVLVIFAVMLVRTQELFVAREDKGRKAGGIILMLIIMGGIGGIFLASGMRDPTFGNPNVKPLDIKEIGKSMLTYYSPALIGTRTYFGWCSYRCISTCKKGGYSKGK